MEYRNLGNSGLKVSVLSFGNMTSGLEVFKGKKDEVTPELEQTHFQYIDMCIKAGINFFDTAEIYGLGVSEQILGMNLKQGGWDRDELIISTKLMPRCGGIQGNSRKRMRVGICQSLKRLQLDNVDVLFLHRIDRDVPLLEQISTINEIIEKDQAYYWGTSEFSASELTEIHLLCEKYGFIHPIAEQCQYNMFARKAVEVDYAPLFDQYRLGTTVWSPLAAGLLAGRYNDGKIPDDSRYATMPLVKARYNEYIGWRENNGADMLQGLKAISDELGCTQGQLALAWVLYNKDVSTALFGANKPEHITDNLGAVSVLKKLNPEVLERIEKLLINRPAPPIDFRTFTPQAPRR